MRRLMQGPISDLEDETKVGDIVFIEDDASPAGNHLVTGIIFRRCIKHLVLDDGRTVPCSIAKKAILRFVPVKEDTERGRFAVIFEMNDEDGDPEVTSNAHIVPLFGKHHEICTSCWCSPKAEMHKDGSFVFSHSASQ